MLLSRELVGRTAEESALARTVDAAAARQGGALVLVGEAGIGKSRLRREAEHRADERGLRLVCGRAVEPGPREPYRPLIEGLAAGFRTTGLPADRSLTPLRPTLGQLVPEWSAGSVPGASALVVAESLLRLLDVAGRKNGSLFVVDDVHWADTDTLQVLEYLIDNAAAHGAQFLLTLRPEPPGEALRMVRRLADRRAAALVDLPRLTAQDVERMVLSCLGEDAVPSELLEFVQERADGIPFLVEELLAGLQRSGALVSDPTGLRLVGHRMTSTVPATLADSVARRFESLNPRTQHVLFAAALLGRRFDWRLLPRVTELEDSSVAASLREATYAQLLTGDTDTIRFRHALTRDHVLDLMLPPDRIRMARRAVAAVEAAHPALPGEWYELAAELSELAGEPERAARHLVAAAEQAHARGALATATARLERALVLAPDHSGLLLDVREALAQVRALAGDVDGAIECGSQALRVRQTRGDAPSRETELELTLGRAALTAGWYDRAREYASRARRRAGEFGDRTRYLLATSLSAQIAVTVGDTQDAARLGDTVLAEAGTDQPDARCEALEVLGRCSRVHDVGRAEAYFEASLATAQEHRLLLWRARALHELGTIDLLDRMRTDRLREARRAAVEAGAPATVAVTDFHLASALVARGETAAGRVVAERSVAEARRLGLAILPFALTVLARTYAHERRVDAMETAVREIQAAAGGDPSVRAGVWSHVRAMLALHEANRRGARAALDQAIELLRSCPGHHDPHWGMWALLRTIDDDGGRSARREAARAAGSGTRLTRALLRAATAVAAGREGDIDRAVRDYDDCVRMLDGYEGGAWLIHLTRWLIAPAALDDGWGQPVGWLQAAVRWFGSHGYDPLAASCRVLLRDAGGRVPRRGRGMAPVPEVLRACSVTSREVDVLRLLAERMTNRQIADRLVLSPKTVEKHVASLLLKTGRPDRRALAEFAGSLESFRSLTGCFRPVKGGLFPTAGCRRGARMLKTSAPSGRDREETIMEPVMGEPFAAVSDIHVLPTYWPVPNAGVLPMNAFVIRGAEPVLVDTGVGVLSDDFVDALASIISPGDLRWIWLTHEDRDHTGSLRRLLELAPQARLAASFFAVGRILPEGGIPLDRLRVVNPGEVVNVGDRNLAALRPPLYDSPSTTGFLDDRTGTVFSSDCFGAPLPGMAEAAAHDIAEIPEQTVEQGQLAWATVDSPWVTAVDENAFGRAVGSLERLEPSTILSSHLPPIRGRMDRVFTTLRATPKADPVPAMTQTELETLLAEFEPAG